MSSGHRGKQGGKRPRPSTGSSPEGPALLPAIKNLLAEEIGKVLDRIQVLELNFEAKIKKFEEKLNDVVNSVTFNEQSISEFQQKMKEDKEIVNQEIDSLKSYINRENLLFHGIVEGNQQEDVENLLRDFFVEHLRFDRASADEIEFQRAHRINSARRPRPIIARFLRYKDRAAVFQKAKNLKGSRMFITEDLPLRIRERQRAQLPALKAARSSGKMAYFSRSEPWKLYIDRVYVPRERQQVFIRQLPTETHPGNPGIRLQVAAGAESNLPE
ncbi:uncharacterized protein LOC121408764 [Lytechinus variegatus]|uniref:uncharacterized protein LOC121408764 n=1 Tax=Lytechinus variegatus TaxID=7654 RepID=UPI001BB1DDCD|nr:uncharacterized protein LOC121408764 [Lytechinus variegatus]